MYLKNKKQPYSFNFYREITLWCCFKLNDGISFTFTGFHLCTTMYRPKKKHRDNLIHSTFAGGDCKTLMFVQISPSSTDSGETLCSLNFASRARAVEHGPVRKQVDPAESLKFKQMVF